MGDEEAVCIQSDRYYVYIVIVTVYTMTVSLKKWVHNNEKILK